MTVWRARTERGVEADEIKKRIDVLDPDVQLSSTAVAEAAAPVHETPAPAESLAAPSLASPGATAPPEAASRVAASDDAGIETLVGELRKALHHLEGEEKLLQALPIVSQLVELQPEKVELLQRKLAYALKLGEEQVAIEAYLGLGAALEARLDSFSLRFLTSAAAEGVTTAIRVQPVTDARTAERDV
jgi:hypothetical protein